ncbi:MAG: ABC transporter permease [Chloroflexota bacterium]|nr:ABC transporter permease [Chloroflexota bacterium]
MFAYTVRRVLWLVPVLLGVATITFVLMHVVPGGPWDQEKTLAPQVVQNLNRRYGLDKPVWRQYVDFLSKAARGDLGVSYTYQDRSVTSIIRSGFPVTASLGLIAFALSIGIGLPLGLAAASKQNSLLDYFSVFFATSFASTPGFVLGILLMILFSVNLHWLPTSGWGTPQKIIMPAIALAALPAAYTARLTRASVLEVIRQDYIRTARAKGLQETVIYYRHVLKNALIPVLTIMGPELAYLVTGSFIIEALFSIPGVGRLFVQGVFQRDYGLIMGTVLFYAFIVAILNLVVDLLYAAVDPRIRLK